VNGPGDVASILHALNVQNRIANELAWTSLNQVKQKGKKGKGKQGGAVMVGAIDLFQRMYMHRVDKTVVAGKLPQLIVEPYFVPTPGFTREQTKYYNELLTEAKDLNVQRKKDGGDFNMIRLNNIMGELNQMLIHPILASNPSKNIKGPQIEMILANPTNKIRAFKDLITSLLTTPRYKDEKGNVTKPHNKVIVVSPYTTVLQIFRGAYNQTQGWSATETRGTCIFDGQLSPAKRQEMINRFLHTQSEKVMFLSLKAGSEGIHLVSDIGPTAMIFVQNWFAKASHLQCEKRIHRLGQTKDVNIYYLMVRKSLDDAIYKLHKQKEFLANVIQNRGAPRRLRPTGPSQAGPSGADGDPIRLDDDDIMIDNAVDINDDDDDDEDEEIADEGVDESIMIQWKTPGKLVNLCQLLPFE
jgi:hypothetical protein